MIVGVLTVAGVLAVVTIDAINLRSTSGGAQKLTADVFAITAAGLAVAAAFELAYTLYTPGPDEALNPLLLGVSSAFLFLASKSTQLDWQFGFAAAFVAAALYGLFKIRERFALAEEDEQNSGANKDKSSLERSRYLGLGRPRFNTPTDLRRRVAPRRIMRCQFMFELKDAQTESQGNRSYQRLLSNRDLAERTVLFCRDEVHGSPRTYL
jgi:hypothetical protein